MTKEQFFMELEECLEGEVSSRELSDSMAYYRQYIDEQTAAGKTEEEVIRELGSARLIARSIIDAHGAGSGNEAGAGSYGSGYSERSYNDYDNYDDNESPVGQNNVKDSLQRVGRTVVSVAVTVAVLVVIFFLLRALLPVALVIAAVVLIMRLLRG